MGWDGAIAEPLWKSIEPVLAAAGPLVTAAVADEWVRIFLEHDCDSLCEFVEGHPLGEAGRRYLKARNERRKV